MRISPKPCLYSTGKKLIIYRSNIAGGINYRKYILESQTRLTHFKISNYKRKKPKTLGSCDVQICIQVKIKIKNKKNGALER